MEFIFLEIFIVRIWFVMVRIRFLEMSFLTVSWGGEEGGFRLDIGQILGLCLVLFRFLGFFLCYYSLDGRGEEKGFWEDWKSKINFCQFISGCKLVVFLEEEFLFGYGCRCGILLVFVVWRGFGRGERIWLLEVWQGGGGQRFWCFVVFNFFFKLSLLS